MPRHPTPPGSDALERDVCPTCRVTAGGPPPTPAGEQLEPAAWTWSDPYAAAALRSRDLGAILRAFRRIHALNQQQMAARLGYDKTYVSMIETGRRVVHDVPTRRHIAGILAIPPHLLGVTDPADSEHVAMLAFAESTIRLADLARSAGHAADAVNELWSLVARLEARATEGHLEADTLAVLGQAWVSLGVCLGTVLPEERLTVAAEWTHKGVAAAEQLEDQGLLSRALAMHGNELRKSGQLTRAVPVLERAVLAAPLQRDASAGLAFLARAAAELGDAARFTTAITHCHAVIQDHGPCGFLDPFTCREIHLRGLLDLGDVDGAASLAETAPTTAAPAPQWDVIASVTNADFLLATGAREPALRLLYTTVDQAARHRLPHQIQRIMRIARQAAMEDDLLQHARAALAAVCSRPILGGHPC